MHRVAIKRHKQLLICVLIVYGPIDKILHQSFLFAVNTSILMHVI